MQTPATRICLLVILFLLLSITASAQSNSNDELPRGVVIENVKCKDDPAQTYALYLPSNYSPEKRWPVLYAFDPSALGKRPVDIFREAAEHFGFILVGSNNSRNNFGTDKLTESITAFWKDTHARFSIDEKRAYATGMSGGARVASYFASSCNGCIAGVIACAATFPPTLRLDKALPFSVFGTLGVDDFNYPELIRNFAKLDENGTTNHLATFDGRHGWLPKELAFEALGWMNLQAMKSGRLEMNRAFIEDFLKKQTDSAQTLFQKGDLVGAARNFELIISDFKTVSDTKHAAGRLAEVRSQKAYKKLADEDKQSVYQQQNIARKIIAMGVDLLDRFLKPMTMKSITDEMEPLRKRSKASGDSSERRVARRVLGQIYAAAYEAALYVNERQKDYDMMIANLELLRLVNPENPHSLLELARAFALAERKTEALDTLQQAVKKGFADCTRIINKSEWTNLRGAKEFQKIVKQLNCSES